MSNQICMSIDAFLVPQPLNHLKSLREKNDRASLYQVIVLGGAFIEGLGLLWFQEFLGSKKIEFHWKDGSPYIEMGQILKLLNSVKLLDDGKYGVFLNAANYRNRVVHRMYSQWSEELKQLETMADTMIKCAELILTRSGRQPI